MPATTLETAAYRLSRTQMARLASMEYLRTFWWVAAGIPLGGLIFVIVGHGGLMEVVGLFALMWPFSIPARAVMVTTRPARLFVGGVRMLMTDEALEFQGQTPGKNGCRLRMTLPRDDIRDVVVRGDMLLIRTMHFGFVPVGRAAFDSTEDEARFIREASTRDIGALPG